MAERHSTDRVSTSRTVAIVGAGPCGSALAIRLRQRDVPVVLIDSDKRPPLLVGESLIPAAIPHLDALGVLDDIKRIGVHKPGASLLHTRGERVDFQFRDFGKHAPDYALNVPRPAFDEVLTRRACALGVRRVRTRARLQRGVERELELDEATLEVAGLSSQPGLIVDATGRARAASRTLGLSTQRGGRDDVACFAHFSGARCPELSDGRILISVLERGWSWCIPLPGRVSVGVVIPRAELASAGGKAETLLVNRIAAEPILRERLKGASRVTDVMRYEHYQLVGERATGRGWAAVGDAFGFVDPMLSPGVFMALESASLLAPRIRASAGTRGVQVIDTAGYEARLRSWFSSWSDVIDTFYDGRMLALQKAARTRAVDAGPVSVHRVAEAFTRRAIAQLVSGANTRSRVSRGVLAHSCQHLLEGAGVGERAIDFAVKGQSAPFKEIKWVGNGATPVPFG